MNKSNDNGRSPASTSPESSAKETTRPVIGLHKLPPPVTVLTSPELVRYTLTRDDERPLQFDGIILVEIESAGSPTTHRAALYRTRAGKFVSEFSSGPKKSTAQTAAEVAEIMDSLVTRICDQAESYEGKAIEDVRNVTAAETLRVLAHDLMQIPSDRPEWGDLAMAYRTASAGLGSTAEELKLIRAHAFNGGGRASFFLRDVIANYRACARDATAIEGVPHRSGKAAVFHDLESALAFFRPGRLTNELLKKLGRWDPEFIE
jgi:hypothetical protein